MSWDSVERALERLPQKNQAYWSNYLGFYSSWLDGYFREPWAMLLPLDDHGFHRGDGIFEAARIHERAYIDLGAHLHRLENSARAIGLKIPKTHDEIRQICIELARKVNRDFAALRLFVTRGPGSFSPNPAESVAAQLYVVLTEMRLPSEVMYQQGAGAMFSTIRAKEAFWSQIKSCNYLQNVLMKKEAVEKGFDFAISVDESGRLCEGATENLLLVNKDDEIIVPKFDYTLRGTTVLEVMKIAQELKKNGQVRDVRLSDVSKDDLRSAREAAFVGTTLGVLPLTRIDETPIGRGVAGPIAALLHQRLMQKMSSDPTLRTPF